MRKMILTMTIAAAQMFGGGFWLQVGNPEASAEARKANAVFTIKAAGCHDPASAKVTVTAIGMVDGQRQSMPVTVTKLKESGMFAVTQQWPREGKWVIQVEGRSDGIVTSTLLNAGPQGVDRYHTKSEMRAFASEEIEAMLR